MKTSANLIKSTRSTWKNWKLAWGQLPFQMVESEYCPFRGSTALLSSQWAEVDPCHSHRAQYLYTMASECLQPYLVQRLASCMCLLFHHRAGTHGKDKKDKHKKKWFPKSIANRFCSNRLVQSLNPLRAVTWHTHTCTYPCLQLHRQLPCRRTIC